MSRNEYFTHKTLGDLKARVAELGLAGDIGFVEEVRPGTGERLFASPARFGPFQLANRLVAHPMEGWDCDAATGALTDDALRRWRRMAESGASLLWGMEAMAVGFDYRANSRQFVINRENLGSLAGGMKAVREAGSTNRLAVGAQITCSGRYSFGRPKGSPLLLTYHHPELDKRVGDGPDTPLMTDSQMEDMAGLYAGAARLAREAGFDFIDIKSCHRYWLNETLAAKTRPGKYGGSFANRTKILFMIIDAVKREVGNDFPLGVRLNLYDGLPHEEDPETRRPGLKGRGRVSPFTTPYLWGWGVDEADPAKPDLTEPLLLAGMLGERGIKMINTSVGSPYSNPHMQRPTDTPPVDGYQPFRDPLIDVAIHLALARELKRAHPEMSVVGTGFTYFRGFKAHAMEFCLREKWMDAVGVGRALLSFPDELRMLVEKGEASPGKGRIVCTGDSSCTTGPRLGLKSGCVFDPYYSGVIRDIRDKMKEMGLEGK
jgi:2,4-dienoyl-CoA reductase-like NADH-dependent reductase (Old Yellow Enzyme family)